MAKTDTIGRVGFGQVEPNHLSAQFTGQIYAQLPAHIKAGESDLVPSIEVLENGQFAKYDELNGEVNFTGKGEWMMVFNEVKLYDGWRETYKDFAMQNKNFTNKVMTPRLIKLNIGDFYTTNCVGGAGAKDVKYAGISITEGDVLTPDANGYLIVDTAQTADYQLQVAKITTLPDNQKAVKLVRIK